MTKLIELSEDAFVTLFKPVANHLNPNTSFDWGDGNGTLFETFGEELAHVQEQDVNHIWTLCSGDGGDYVASGFHFVNRLGYFITEVPVPEGVEIHVPFDNSSGQPLPPRVVASLHTVIDYLWDDEEKHYLAEDQEGKTDAFIQDPMHIFQSLQVIRTWLEADDAKASGGKPTSTRKD